jgi:hypothetical protein
VSEAVLALGPRLLRERAAEFILGSAFLDYLYREK